MGQVKSLQCDRCGARLEPRQESFHCPYCGTYLVVSQAQEDAPQSESGDDLVRRGVKEYNAGNYDRALGLFEQAIRLPLKRNRLADVRSLMGDTLDYLGQYEAALEAYRDALRLDPKTYKAWVGQGITYRHLNRLEDTERCYQEAMRINPKYGALHASLGQLYIVRGEAEKAVASLEKALALDPSLATAHANAAVAFAMVGRFDDADKELQQAVALGYKEYKTIQQRIRGLRELAE